MLGWLGLGGRGWGRRLSGRAARLVDGLRQLFDLALLFFDVLDILRLKARRRMLLC